MKETFERISESSMSPSASLSALTNPEMIASWLPILSNVTEVERLRRYTAVLEDRVGPFSMRADLQIRLEMSDDSIAVAAEGRDRQIGSRIRFEGKLRAVGDTADAPTCQIRMTASYEITGKAAQMGGSKIRKKADAIVEGFTSSLRNFLSEPRLRSDNEAQAGQP